jgi:hypothetical protein
MAAIAEHFIRAHSFTAKDSNRGNAASFALPAACGTTNSIYLRFDLLLAHNGIGGIIGGCFIPPALDAAKCQAVLLSRYTQHFPTPYVQLDLSNFNLCAGS